MSDYLQKTANERPDLGPIITLLKRFESAQGKYADHGAWDTEPDGEWHHVLREGAHGRPYPGTRTANDWQLYSSMKGVGAAARRLTQVAEKAHEKLAEWREGMPAGQWRQIETFLRDYCWRVDWDHVPAGA